MTEDELRAASEIVADLYRRRTANWVPILAYGFANGSLTWTPKAEEGNRPRATGAVKIGVWGGACETYERGFNQQPCELLWTGIDVDAKGGQTYAGGDLPEAVAAVLPEAMVRRSSSGLGAHVFLHLEYPAVFPTKLEAQRAAQVIAAPYVERLSKAGIKSDIVGRNQLWVFGGNQVTIQLGHTINPAIEIPEIVLPADSSPGILPLDSFGPMCRRIIETLDTNGVIRINGGVAKCYRFHIEAAQIALRTIPWLKSVMNVTTTYDKPNAVLLVKSGFLILYTFSGGGKTVFKFPVGL